MNVCVCVLSKLVHPFISRRKATLYRIDDDDDDDNDDGMTMLTGISLSS